MADKPKEWWNMQANAGKPDDQIFENSGFTSKDPKGNIVQNPMLNPDGSVKNQFKLNYQSVLPQVQNQLNGVNVNTQGLDAIRNRALSAPGTESPWLHLQNEQLQSNLGQMRDQAGAQGLSNQADAMSSLARSGGLTSGARERISRQGMMDQNTAAQNIAHYGGDQANQLAIQDENTKNQMLMQLPGMETQKFQTDLSKTNDYLNELNQDQIGKANMDQYNLSTSKDELVAKRAFDVNQYNQKMQAWAAGKTADAQGNASMKGK